MRNVPTCTMASGTLGPAGPRSVDQNVGGPNHFSGRVAAKRLGPDEEDIFIGFERDIEPVGLGQGLRLATTGEDDPFGHAVPREYGIVLPVSFKKGKASFHTRQP